ncbi:MULTISPECIES: flagellin N-terminal helical domain-containing protein [unclassified Butyrivibrio]|uniref:flagellin N-terminal helical domain-containing protein n=1 Tax=unclassified Butyrivibrio TaxID=2639466 RepID=UPI0008E70DDA|nr:MULTISPECIES: flagellin [unclassified Butyrivibrio]MBR4669465.1 flagellin [Butyrivibrio sp.]RKM54335.1 flagellin [Butyrivibrio sp. X503]RKM59582.1 flagellin [Butyrivibrio sp. XB500-5]SFU66114.1 flagellin [Butyrivibrio sp. INlla21]
MVVQHNVTAMNANRQLGITTGIQAKSSEKLSSGYKINRAADDAAGLAISEKMRRQVRGLTQASANAQDGISAVQTAEGALNEVHDMLQRMNELAVKAANDTLTTSDRRYIQSEVDALVNEIHRTGEATQFNDTKLLDGTFVNKNLQVGSDKADNNVIKIDIVALTASGLEIDGTKVNVTGTDGVNARNSIGTIKAALEKVSKQRSDLGAIQNRLEHTIKNLDNVVENTQAAESLIRDTDMAEEMVRYSNNNILAQAGQSMLAQANQTNQGVLSLLQ